MGGIKKPISQYQKKIREYQKSKKQIIEKYGYKSKEYSGMVQKINMRLWHCMKMERRLLAKRKNLDLIISTIEEFTSHDLRNNYINPKKKEGKLAKGIYFKYGMEHGFTGVDLSERLGIYKNSGKKIRRRFTKSFIKNKYNREMYHRFLNYIEDIDLQFYIKQKRK